MKYLLLIYGDEKVYNETVVNDPQAFQAEMDEYFAFGRAGREAGVVLGGEALLDTSAATTVRVRDGRTLTTHGPFAETKEQLGGYYIVECANLDEAITWAARIPGARHGSVEIRPIMEFDDP